jgi:hypothetical protein
MHTKLPLVWVLGAAILLAGCFEESNGANHLGGGIGPGGSSGSGGGGSGGGGSGAGGGGTQNQPPTISGVPPLHVLEGEPYEFMPSAADPDGDALEFSISRKPAWADFDRASGRLSGTPGAGDVGNFTNIAIGVTDGKSKVNLGAFDVTVDQIAAGSATLSWAPPTENADGSALTDLAGYRIYYGRNRDRLTRFVEVDNPSLTRYVIENLSQARWFFTMTSVNSRGVESSRSATASKTIG